MRELTYAQAINEGIREEMRRDPNIVVLGEDVGKYGGVFGVTRGLYDEFGGTRVRDCPLNEAAIVGFSVGLAIAGRPAGMTSGGWSTSIPSLSNTGEFDPGIKKTWAYTFQRNEEETVNGRPAGSLMWAGLGNLYFWIDRKNGVGGYWGTQILPFMDVSSYPGFVDFEAAVYRSLK